MLGFHLKARTKIPPPIIVMHCEFDRYVMLLCICTAVLIEAWLEFWLTAVQRLALAYCPC
ncbi:hypothetical protein CV770_31455 [Bradyrhizobium sp. AC87j1]|nr:hypothetical protein CV770_31455 [Bradyrhizobium sp. AC87j1]